MPSPSTGNSPGPSVFPMDEATWHKVSASLALSPQQTRIVELILHGKQDKEIAAELNVAFSTLRSHLERIYRRLEVSSSKGVILLVFRTAQQLGTCTRCGQ